MYEISNATHLSYNDLVNEEQLISKWAWVKMRLQKATAADERHRCGYDDCDDPITIENKKALEHFRKGKVGDETLRKRTTFHIGMHVIREQWSAQTFNTLHVMCAIRKLHRVQLEMEEGIHALTESAQELINKGISNDDE